jgi:hypothetical protein
MTPGGTPLTIAGSVVEVTHEVVSLEEVRLNPDNPRIRFQIKHRKGGKTLSPDELLDLIREQPGYDSLQKAIRKVGGIHEHVIVRHDGLVIEGNTRAAVYMTLHSGNKADARWKKIPIARLPKTVSESVLARLMASYHIAGKTVWRPYAQADQVYHLRHTHGLLPAQIADETRMSEREVEQYLEAYEYLVKEVLPHVANGNGSDILESKWSHALEFIKRKNLAPLRKDPVVRKQVAKLIVENKIKGAEVRELDKVLKSAKASTALNKNGFKAAREVLSETDPVAASKTLKKMKSFAQSLSRMKQTDVTLLKTSDKARQILIELHEAVCNVATVSGIKLSRKHA